MSRENLVYDNPSPSKNTLGHEGFDKTFCGREIEDGVKQKF